jgi:hypothetical protein
MDCNKMYHENERFKTYVDKQCSSYGLTVKDALELYIVKEVAKYYADPDNRTYVSCETLD